MMSGVDNSSFVIIYSLKNFNCQAGKLRTEFTSPKVKSTSLGLSDTTFLARCKCTVCTCNPPCEQTLLLPSWSKETLPELHQTFETAAAQTSGLVNLVLSHQTVFFKKHPFIDKLMVVTKPAEESAQLLGLGSKLYPSNIPCMLNKDLTRFMQSLSWVRQNQTRLCWQGTCL